MSNLTQNYCVNCGNVLKFGDQHLCRHCNEKFVYLPSLYSSEHDFYCTYCKARLDRYFDFNVDGSFKSDDYFCIGCSFVHEWPDGFDTQREVEPEAFSYIYQHAHEVPMHVLQAWVRQNDFFINRVLEG
jgi:hypothetical protein